MLDVDVHTDLRDQRRLSRRLQDAYGRSPFVDRRHVLAHCPEMFALRP